MRFLNFIKVLISMPKEIAIFGGAFDPPHNGHIQIINKLKEAKEFDEIWILPSGDRNDKKLLLSMKERWGIL